MKCDKCHCNKCMYFSHCLTETDIFVCFDCMYDVNEYWWKNPERWKTFELLYDGPPYGDDRDMYCEMCDLAYGDWEANILALDNIDEVSD